MKEFHCSLYRMREAVNYWYSIRYWKATKLSKL